MDIINNLKEIGVLRNDNSYNTRMGMKFFKSDTFKDIRDVIFKKTNFLDNCCVNSQRIHAVVHQLTCLPSCPTCNSKKLKFISFNQGYNHFCSSKCVQGNKEIRDKIRKTNIQKYGSSYPCGNKKVNEKRKQTCQEKYCSDSPFESSEIQNKVRESIEMKYGVKSTVLIPTVHEKQKQTRLKRHGVEFPFQSVQIQYKVNQTHKTNFGTSRFSQSLIPQETLNNLENKEFLSIEHHKMKKPLTQIASEMNVSDVTVGNYLHKHGLETKHFSFSTGEKQVLETIQSILPTTEIIENTQKIISPYELDIYIPSHNLAIEYCGLYWHSDKFKENYYHRNKTLACQQEGIRLLTVFEDEWRDKRDIVISKLKSILHEDNSPSVFARKTKIVSLKTKQKKEFLNKNHIQGSGPGSITYGLTYNNELVAVMTFIKRKTTTFELNRYATSTRVVGGFSKLLKHFQQNHQWEQIVSFADLRWSEGNLYEQTGWKLDKTLPPDYFWCRNSQRHHKFNFRHKFLSERLEFYDPELSENQNCKNNGYVKIFSCGLKRFVINR